MPSVCHRCVEDREVLDGLARKHGFADKMQMINYVVDPSKVYRPPVPLAQVKPFGVTHYLSEMVQGNEIVMKVLCDTCRLHTIGAQTTQ
eukprot:SAG22_NODE_706_length_7763_cov_4.404228_6_plen_89_part_00